MLWPSFATVSTGVCYFIYAFYLITKKKTARRHIGHFILAADKTHMAHPDAYSCMLITRPRSRTNCISTLLDWGGRTYPSAVAIAVFQSTSNQMVLHRSSCTRRRAPPLGGPAAAAPSGYSVRGRPCGRRVNRE